MKVKVFYNSKFGYKLKLIRSEISFYDFKLGYCYYLFNKFESIRIPIFVDTKYKNISHYMGG